MIAWSATGGPGGCGANCGNVVDQLRLFDRRSQMAALGALENGDDLTVADECKAGIGAFGTRELRRGLLCSLRRVLTRIVWIGPHRCSY